jgi:hypothetical protein
MGCSPHVQGDFNNSFSNQGLYPTKVGAGVGSSDPFQPDFVPEDVLVPRRKHAMMAIIATARHSFENDTDVAWTHHLTGFFIKKLINASQHPERSIATIGHHFNIEP